MGLTRTTFTAQDSDTDVARFSGNSTTTRVYNANDGRRAFVSHFSAYNRVAPYELVDQLHRSSRVTIRTTAEGVKNLTLTLNGKVNYSGGIGSSSTENERYMNGPVYWGVTTSSTSRPSSYSTINITSSWDGSKYLAASSISSTINNINLVPNATYYLWIWYGGNCCGYGANGLSLSASGVYGEPGDITASDGTFGSDVSISFASATSGAKYTVKTSVTVDSGGNSGTTLYEETLQTNLETSSILWTPAISTYAPKLLNHGSTVCTITVSTYFGTSLAGTKQKTITLSFDSTAASPVLDSGCFGVAPVNSGAVAGLSGYIQNYSLVRASYDSSKVTLWQGATVKEWRVKFGTAADITVASTTTTQDSSAVDGDMTVVCTLVDSRGFTAQQSFSLTVYSYSNPVLSPDAVTYYRCAADSDSPSDTGTRLAILPVVTFSSVGGQNSLTFVFKWKYISVSNWTDKTSAASPALANNTKSFFTNFEDRSYDLYLIVTDTLGNSTEWRRSIPSSKHFLTSTTGWDGAAFNKVAEYSDTLDIGSWELLCGDVACGDISCGDVSGGAVTCTTLSTTSSDVKIKQISMSASVAVGNDHTSITAPTIAGYTFVCWYQVVSVGWVGLVYASTPNTETTNVWLDSSATAAESKDFRAYALYVSNNVATAYEAVQP